MSEPKRAIPDPDNVPITHVTGFVSNILNGQTVAMNYVTDRMAIYPDGSGQSDLAIAARLRFDLDVARRIRDQLNIYLNALSPVMKADEKPN